MAAKTTSADSHFGSFRCNINSAMPTSMANDCSSNRGSISLDSRDTDDVFPGLYDVLTSGRIKKKALGDDTEAPKAPRLRRRVLHGIHNRSGGNPPSPGNSSTGPAHY